MRYGLSPYYTYRWRVVMIELLPPNMFLQMSDDDLTELMAILPEKIVAISDMSYMLDNKVLRIQMVEDLMEALREGNRMKAQAIFETAVDIFKDSPLTTVH